MSLYKQGRFWYYDFEYHGKRYKESTEETSKILARDKETDKLKELRAGKAAVVDITFKDLGDKYLKIHAANKRGKHFFEYSVRVLNRDFGEKLLSEITPADVDGYMAQRRAAVATATANRTLSVLKHMLKTAIRWHHLDVSPAADVKLEREPKARERFLTDTEATTLLEKSPKWLRPLVLTALHTGARQGELLALTWEDVDLDRARLTFRQTKNGEPRTIKASTTVVETLTAIKPRFGGGIVFHNEGGDPMHRDGVTWSFRRALRLAEIQDFRFHDLRHSAASFMVQAGIPLNTVREILGHKSLAMTLRYAHLAPDHQQDAMKAMDALTFSGSREFPHKSETEARRIARPAQ